MPVAKKERRAPDPRIAELHAAVTANSPKIAKVEQDLQHLHECVESIKLAVEANTVISKQVADILGTFRVTLAIGKWISAVGGGFAVVVAVMKGWKP